MENTFKRQSRHPDEVVKKKISQAMKGKPKTDAHKAAISKSLRDYWGNDDNFPRDREGETTIYDIM
jgi:hypothetical protein